MPCPNCGKEIIPENSPQTGIRKSTRRVRDREFFDAGNRDQAHRQNQADAETNLHPRKIRPRHGQKLSQFPAGVKPQRPRIS